MRHPLTMLLLLAALWPGAALAGSAGGGFLVLGWQSSARHLVHPAAFAWVTPAEGPVVPTLELLGTWRSDAGGVYRYQAAHLRASAVVEYTVGQHATRLHVGAGAALSARLGTLETDEADQQIRTFYPGARVRVALQGPIKGGVAFCWQIGATTRRTAVDYDAALGLGGRW